MLPKELKSNRGEIMRAKLILVIGSLMALGMAATPAHAHWGVGVRIGIPLFVGPYYSYCPYYAPYPVYVQPAPAYYVQPAPIVYQQAPVYVQPASVAVQPAPAVQTPIPVRLAAAQAPVAEERQTEISNNLEHLRNPDEQARVDAVSRLGRLKAARAVDPLAATLAGDSSPRVREAAAKALGMIGSPKGLPALQHAALNDNDRDVRHSAQFSVELVQAGR
jgi:hypothetical protein